MSWSFMMRDGDWVVEENGQPMKAEGFNKANLDVLHALLHPYDPSTDYGNESFSTEVQVIERASIPGIIQRNVGAAISRLRASQSRIPRAQLPDTERIVGIRGIKVTPNGLGAEYEVVVTVADRKVSEVSQGFMITNRQLYVAAPG